jgi:hypothetical protein
MRDELRQIEPRLDRLLTAMEDAILNRTPADFADFDAVTLKAIAADNDF